MNWPLWITAVATVIYATVATATLIFIARSYKRQIRALMPLIGFESSPEESLDWEKGIKRTTFQIKNHGLGPAYDIYASPRCEPLDPWVWDLNEVSGVKSIMSPGDTAKIGFQWERIPESYTGLLTIKVGYRGIHNERFSFFILGSILKGGIFEYELDFRERLRK